MSVNRVILLGRLGKDPEVSYAPSGACNVKLSVATSEAWKDKDGNKQERTEWHRVSVWGKLAELCNQYLAKGRQIYVEGRLSTSSWEDKQGNRRYTTEIIAQTVQFIGERSQSETRSQGETPQEQEYTISEPTFTNEDLPF